MKKQKGLRLYCFSPPVMIATFFIEVVAALYVFYRYKSTNSQRIAIVTLLLLATFQFAEYNVCGRYGISSGVWSRVGYVAITLLPALGMHLTHTIAKKKPNRLVAGGYASAALFSALFAFGGAFESYSCGGNYVIFQLKSPIGGLFFIYYYAWLFAAVFAATRFYRQKRQKKSIKVALRNHVVGYALFVIPASTAMLVFPETASALPSVMCGFAVLYALMLTLKVLPYTEKTKSAQHHAKHLRR